MTTWYAQNGSGDLLSGAFWNDAPDGSGDPGTPVDGDVLDLNGQAGLQIGQVGNFQMDVVIQDSVNSLNTLETSGYNNLVGGNATGLTLNVAVQSNGAALTSATPGAPIFLNAPLTAAAAAAAGSPIVVGTGGSIIPDGSLLYAAYVDIMANPGVDLSGLSALGTSTTSIGSFPGLETLACMVALPVGESNSAIGSNGLIGLYLPPVSTVSDAESYGLNGTQYTGTFSGGTIPAASNVRSGVAVGAGTGTLVVPSAANVRHGVTFDNGTTGTAYIPAAADVRLGTHTDATTGTLAVPTASQVLNGVAVDATDGNVVLPMTAVVLAGVTFGPASADSGTLAIDNADIASTLTAVNAINTLASAIKAKTDNLPASPAAVGSQVDLVSAPNATAVSAIQNGLATASALSSAVSTLAGDISSGASAIESDLSSVQSALEAEIAALPSASSIAAAVGGRSVAIPAPGAPPATPTADQVAAYLYCGKMFDGHADGNANTRDIRNASGTVICIAAIGFSGGVYSQGAMGAPS
jgi:hypothetical protein